jgi:DNA-binding MarR family transcriptional regulator
MASTMPATGDPLQNELLASVPESERDRVFSLLHHTYLHSGDTLYEPDADLSHVYFPTTALVSLGQAMDDGTVAEVAAIGSEGGVGLDLILRAKSPVNRAIVQSSGHGYSVAGWFLKAELSQHGDTRCLWLRYAQTVAAQMTQTVTCNRRHSVDHRLCRWLLMRSDRIGTDELAIPRQEVAEILGVSQENLTRAFDKLRALNLVQRDQNQIEIVDRVSVEARACECYGVVKREAERLRGSARARSTNSESMTWPSSISARTPG